MAKEEEKQQQQQQQQLEAQIESALRSRLQHFKDNADSLTLERVRRLLEEDLGLEKSALDVHKRFIKRIMEQLMEDPDAAADVSNNLSKDVEKNVSSTQEKPAESPGKNETKKHLEKPASEDEMKTDDSPIMGLTTTNVDTVDALNAEPSESKIKEAISDRASYIIENSETITPSALRRLLEEDLGLPKNALDPFKKFISSQIDEVFKSAIVPKSSTGSKKKKGSQIEEPEKEISRNSSGSVDSGEEEIVEKVKSRKKAADTRANIEKSKGLNKRKVPQDAANVSRKKQPKIAEKPSEEDADNSGSDDVESEISSEKASKKKQVSTPGYGKHVDKLRSIIKACGMSVAPTVYKKAKQVPDDKREAFLIKELEGILSREGLSANSSEKEIKDVKKKKERAKELEGIDISNIVTSSRRRATTTYMAPPKPRVHEGAKVDKPKSSKKKENEEGDDGDVDNQVKEKSEDNQEKEEKEVEKGGEKEEKGSDKEEGKKDEDGDDENDEDEDDEDSDDGDDSDDEEDDANSQNEESNDDDEESD